MYCLRSTVVEFQIQWRIHRMAINTEVTKDALRRNRKPYRLQKITVCNR